MKPFWPRSLVSIAAIAASLVSSPAQPTLIAAETSTGVTATSEADALFAKLSKILNFGDLHSVARPNKVDAVIALGLLADERAVPILVEHLENEANQNLRMQITRALGWIGSPKAVPALENALHDSYPFTREQAAAALKTITGKNYEFDRTGLPDRAKLIEALRSMGQPNQ